MKQLNLTIRILIFCFSISLILCLSSCSSDPDETVGNTPDAIIPCSVLSISENYNLSESENLEFANLHNDFLTEMTHALFVIRVVFINQDKTLASFINKSKDQINTHITIAEIGPDVFDNIDIGTSNNGMPAKKIATRIVNHALYDASSEQGELITEIVSHADDLTDLAFEIQRYLDEEDMESEHNQASVAQLLENSATLFDCIANKHIVLNKNIMESNPFKNNEARIESELSPLLVSVADLSQAVLSEDTDNVSLIINQIRISLEEFESEEYNLDANQTLKLNEAFEQIEQMVIALENGELNSESDDCYSDGYITYNRLVNWYVNSISPGFVGKINDVISQQYESYLNYVDLPQYYEILLR